MREKIARAIALADERNGAAPYEYRITQSKHAKEQLFDEVDAVLDALMEPTTGMLRAGDKVLCEEIVCNCDEREIFLAMIHAAKEGK